VSTITYETGRQLALEQIRMPENVRTLDEAHVQALAGSIALQGMLVPVVVRSDGESFELVAGFHLVAAARSLGLAEVPVVVRDAETEDADRAVENITSCRHAHLPPSTVTEIRRPRPIEPTMRPSGSSASLVPSRTTQPAQNWSARAGPRKGAHMKAPVQTGRSTMRKLVVALPAGAIGVGVVAAPAAAEPSAQSCQGAVVSASVQPSAFGPGRRAVPSTVFGD
jgi:hypothetical protein